MGGGIGAAIASLGGPRDEGADLVLAYKARAGVRYEISKSALLSLEYQYFDTQDPYLKARDGASFKPEFQNNAVRMELKFGF